MRRAGQREKSVPDKMRSRGGEGAMVVTAGGSRAGLARDGQESPAGALVAAAVDGYRG
jgi:hypothetical protein